MARPLRIEYPGAWYHVMNRGVQRDAHDFMRFLFCFRSFAKIADIKALTQISTNFLLSVTGKIKVI
ncbi:MAG: hypothetical protein U9R02_04310 [Thermodesulfobacteriota bacterium]|nr:hypothetical protein [Thermodesulfobacteriota bacterium]